MSDSLLTVKETAEYFGVSCSTVYRYTSRSKLPHIRKSFGLRFRKTDLDDWLEKDKLLDVSLPRPSQAHLTLLPPIVIDTAKGGSEMPKGKSQTRLTFVLNNETIPGTIYQRKFKNGKRWCINYQTPEGKRIRKVARLAQSKEEAILILQKDIQEAYDHEHSVTRQKEKMKFSDYADKYLNLYAQTNKTSWKTDRSCMKYLKDYFGDKHLADLTSEDMEKLKKEKLRQGAQKSTVNRYLAILRKMLKLAKEWGDFPEEKQIRIKLLSEGDNRKERILTDDEEERLFQESSELVKSVVFFALNTGMRLREILNLKWSQIDLTSGHIKVENTKNRRNRLVGINTPLLRELHGRREVNGHNPYVYANPKTGKPYLDVKIGFKAACRRANIEGLRFHDLRHTFASRLVERGIDLITVKDLLGHSTVRMTERYTHSSQLSKRNAVEILAKKPPEKRDYPESLSRIRHVKRHEEWRARQDSNLRPSDS